jgi:ech hydrogenase subunit A
MLIGLTVGFPVVAGLLARGSQNSWIRRMLIALMTVVLIATSFLMFWRGPFAFTPAEIWNELIIVLDFAILIYFLYVGLKIRHPLVLILTLLQLVPIAYFELTFPVMHVEPTLAIDYLSIVMCLIVSVIGSLTCVYALSYMDEHEKHLQLEKTRQPRFFLYMLLFLGAMNGLVFANNLYWLYFFWEVTTLCCYQLIRHDGTPQAEKNAVLALWMGLIGGVAFTASLFIGYYEVGSLGLDKLMVAQPTTLILLAFAALALASFTKAAQIPFQSWLLGAMVAPTPVSALLHSSTMVKAGVYLVLRISPVLQGTALSSAIALVGGASFLITAVLAISQRESKRILAYSTVGNLGLIILCAGINTPLSMVAALLLLFFHALSKSLLFLCAGIVENRVHSRNIEDWEGLIAKFPLISVIMLIGMSTMFLPPFGMLLAKWMALEAVAASAAQWAITFVVILAIGSSATTLFWSKWMSHLLFRPHSKENLRREKLGSPYLISTLTIVVLDIIVGIVAAALVASLVIPSIKPWYDVELVLPLPSILGNVGAFPIWPIYLVMASALASSILIFKARRGKVTAPYMCGENVEGTSVSFRSTADQEFSFDAAGMFFDKSLSQSKTERYVTMVGILLLVLVFIVAWVA